MRSLFYFEIYLLNISNIPQGCYNLQYIVFGMNAFGQLNYSIDLFPLSQVKLANCTENPID